MGEAGETLKRAGDIRIMLLIKMVSDFREEACQFQTAIKRHPALSPKIRISLASLPRGRRLRHASDSAAWA